MELALNLGGCTAEELSQRMSLREFMQWRRFARRRMFPLQRIELMCAMLVSSWSNKPVDEILVRPKNEDDMDEMASTPVMQTAVDFAAMSGSNVRILKRKK